MELIGKIMKNNRVSLLAPVVFLSACSIGPTPPAQVEMLDGKPVYEIYTSLQTSEITMEALDAAPQKLRGPGRGGLAERASQQCPGGYDIVGETSPDYKISSASPVTTLYYIFQNYRITCT